jgi:hypothetical protein
MEIEEFLTKSKFSKMIEKTVMDLKVSHMEAIVHICEENDLEVEDCAKYINSNVKEKIEAEATKLRLLPQKSTLF